jgi:hypothetical protein
MKKVNFYLTRTLSIIFLLVSIIPGVQTGLIIYKANNINQALLTLHTAFVPFMCIVGISLLLWNSVKK